MAVVEVEAAKALLQAEALRGLVGAVGGQYRAFFTWLLKTLQVRVCWLRVRGREMEWITGRARVCVCMCMCVDLCVRVCVCVCVRSAALSSSAGSFTNSPALACPP